MSNQPTMELTEFRIRMSNGEMEIARGTHADAYTDFNSQTRLTIKAGDALVAEFFQPLGWFRTPPKRAMLSFEDGVKDALSALSQCGDTVSEAYRRGQELGSELYRWRAVQTDIDNGRLKLVDVVPPTPAQPLTPASGETNDVYDDPDDEDEDFSALDDEEDEKQNIAEEISAIPADMIPWTSGECPVDPQAFVHTVYADHLGRTDRFHLGEGVAGTLNWNGKLHNNKGNPQSPIIAYRVVEKGENSSELESGSENGDARVEQTEAPTHKPTETESEELPTDPQWWLNAAQQEGDATIGAVGGADFNPPVGKKTIPLPEMTAEQVGYLETLRPVSVLHGDAAVFAEGLRKETEAKQDTPKRNPFSIFGIGTKEGV